MPGRRSTSAASPPAAGAAPTSAMRPSAMATARPRSKRPSIRTRSGARRIMASRRSGRRRARAERAQIHGRVPSRRTRSGPRRRPRRRRGCSSACAARLPAATPCTRAPVPRGARIGRSGRPVVGSVMRLGPPASAAGRRRVIAGRPRHLTVTSPEAQPASAGAMGKLLHAVETAAMAGASALLRQDELAGSRDPEAIFVVSVQDDQFAQALEEVVARDAPSRCEAPRRPRAVRPVRGLRPRWSWRSLSVPHPAPAGAPGTPHLLAPHVTPPSPSA